MKTARKLASPVSRFLCLLLSAGFLLLSGLPVSAAADDIPELFVGDLVTFGTYPQTEEGTDQTPIQWQVLDVQENRALLLSSYGLDAQPFNTKWSEEVFWHNCTLRAWLNDDFMNRAFTPEDQSAILLTDLVNDRSQGYSGYSRHHGEDTQDKIFLLSYLEAHNYLGVVFWGFHDESNVRSRVTPTPYAKKAGAWSDYTFHTADGGRAGWWWLRSPGLIRGNASRVIWRGSLCNRKINTTDGCVRPSLWVDLGKASSLTLAIPAGE